jgi:hypothetical protein
LLTQNLVAERHVESPKVDQLTCGIDFCLKGRLGLTQHRGGIKSVAPWTGQQVSSLQEDGGPFVITSLAPSSGGRRSSVECGVRLRVRRTATTAEHPGVLMW